MSTATAIVPAICWREPFCTMSAAPFTASSTDREMAAVDAFIGSAAARNASSAWARGLRGPRRKAMAKRTAASNADVPPRMPSAAKM